MKVTIKTKTDTKTFSQGDKVKISDNCLMPYFRGKTGEIKQMDHHTCLVQGDGVSVWLSYYALDKESK